MLSLTPFILFFTASTRIRSWEVAARRVDVVAKHPRLNMYIRRNFFHPRLNIGGGEAQDAMHDMNGI